MRRSVTMFLALALFIVSGCKESATDVETHEVDALSEEPQKSPEEVLAEIILRNRSADSALFSMRVGLRIDSLLADPAVRTSRHYRMDPYGVKYSGAALARLVKENRVVIIEPGNYLVSDSVVRLGKEFGQRAIVCRGGFSFGCNLIANKCPKRPILESEESIEIYINGITFMTNAAGPCATEPSPLVKLTRAYWTLLENSLCHNATGDCLVFGGVTGPTAGSRVILDKVQVRGNYGNGAVFDGTVDFVIRASGFEYNQKSGLVVRAPEDRIMHHGTIENSRFERNGGCGIRVENGIGILVFFNYFYGNDICLDRGTQNTWVLGNFIMESEIYAPPGRGNYIFGNIESWRKEWGTRLMIPNGKMAEFEMESGGEILWWSYPGGTLVVNGVVQERRGDFDPAADTNFILPHFYYVGKAGKVKLEARGSDVLILCVIGEKGRTSTCPEEVVEP